MEIKLALIGDYNDSIIAHRAILKALSVAALSLGLEIKECWIHTDTVPEADLAEFSGFWCVPASPYSNDGNALAAIRHAREQGVPFLGTCGGYQYAALEFARNVLGHEAAENQEVNPDTRFPLISALACRLSNASDRIYLKAGTRLAALYGRTEIEEEYNCGFGVNPEYIRLFDGSPLAFVASNDQGDPRGLELSGHPFFFGTAFQPERSGLKGILHPLVQAFVSAALKYADPSSETAPGGVSA